MKRGDLIRDLKEFDCLLKREGSGYSLWINPKTEEMEAVPRHNEIKNQLARKICKGLSIPEP